MNNLIKPGSTDLTDEDVERLADERSGAGIQDREEDRVQSWVKVLHQLSPELNMRQPNYVEGAKAGDIWIAGRQLLISGTQGFDFLPVVYRLEWVEWPGQPGTGGRPVARYPKAPEQHGGTQIAPGKIDLPNGHQIIETRYFMGVVFGFEEPFPAILTFTSTGTDQAKNWIQRIRSKKNASGKMAPLYRYMWHVTTFPMSNKAGQEWYLLKAGKETLATNDQFKIGLEADDKARSDQLKIIEDESVQQSIDSLPF